MKKLNAVLSKSAAMMAVLSIGTNTWALDLTKSLYPSSVLTVQQDIVLPQGSNSAEFKNGQMDPSASPRYGEQSCVLIVGEGIKPSQELRLAKGTKLELTGYYGNSAFFYSPKGTPVRIYCYELNKSGDLDFTAETLKRSFGDILSVQAAPGSVIDVHVESNASKSMNEKLQEI